MADHNHAFVRTEMLSEQPAPAAETGAIKWIRENLFSSWLNGILTVASLAFIYVVLSAILPWMVNGIWDAGSLSECREIRDARGGSSRAWPRCRLLGGVGGSLAPASVWVLPVRALLAPDPGADPVPRGHRAGAL